MTEPVPLEISCAVLKTWMDDNKEFVLIDCREQEEYEIARIESSKLHPMSELVEHIDELMPHKEETVVVHCHHGGRSMRVVNYLRQQGFEKAINLAGGIHQWSLEIDPSINQY